MAGGDIEISGHVLGDVLSSSGTLRVPGHVDGNIRSYAGNLTLKGTVGRNVMIFGGDVNIDRDAKIGGSITSFTGHESIDGHVKRDVLAMGGQITITGTIGGSAKIKSGELIIDSSAEVGGPIDFTGDKPPQVSAQAKLASPVHFEKLKHGDDYRTVHYYVWQVIWAAAFILFGLVLFAAMPNFSQDAVKSAVHYDSTCWRMGEIRGHSLGHRSDFIGGVPAFPAGDCAEYAERAVHAADSAEHDSGRAAAGVRGIMAGSCFFSDSSRSKSLVR